jgi:hypothetical protein
MKKDTPVISAPEVVVPKRLHEDGLANRLTRSDVGDTIVEAKRFEFDKADKASIGKAKILVVGIMSSAVVKAKQRTDGYEYQQESGQFQTAGGDVMVYAAATRTV